MKDEIFDIETKIRFNLQNLLDDSIDEFDIGRISEVFSIDADIIEERLAEYAKTVELYAGRVDKDNQYSSKIDNEGNASIIFIGDSITSDRISFAKIIGKVFSSHRNISIIDAAVSGWKTTDYIGMFYLKVLSRKAQFAHIMLGTNDVRSPIASYAKSNVSAEEFKRNLSFILSSLKEGNTKVAISTLPPYYLDTDTYRIGSWTVNKSDYDEFNRIIVGFENEPHVMINDMRAVYNKYNAKDVLADDGVHLNIKGHFILAESLMEKLSKML